MIRLSPQQEYIAALVDPAFLSESAPSAAKGLGYLVAGQREAYERNAQGLKLPAWSELATTPRPEVEMRLLRGVAELSSGSDDGPATLAGVIEDPHSDGDVQLAAAIVLGVVNRRSGRPDLAVRILQSQRDRRRTVGDIGARYLDLHLGLSYAFAGEYAMAVESTSAAAADSTPDLASQAIANVARSNLVPFQWAARSDVSTEPIHTWLEPPIARINLYVAEGLRNYLYDYFDAFFENPSTRTFTFRSEDPIDRSLARASFRAEVVGDWFATLEMRKTVGRYQLLSSVQGSPEGLARALLTLVQARDDKGVEKAVQGLNAVGPLEAIRLAATTAGTGPWWSGEMRAVLKLLAHGASSVDPGAGSRILARLLAAESQLTGQVRGTGWLTSEYLRAVGQIASILVPKERRQLADWAFRIAQSDPDPLLHQSMSAVLGAIPWRELSKRERSLWIEYVRRNLTAKNDHVFIARQAAFHLMEAGSALAAQAVMEAYATRDADHLLPLVLNAKRLGAGQREQVLDDVIRIASGLRERADRGEYSFGILDVGRLLGRAAAGPGGRRLYPVLSEFLLDPAVPVAERADAIDELLGYWETLPLSLRKKLSRGLPVQPTGFPMFDEPIEAHLVNVRLMAAARTLAPAQAVRELFALAHATSSEGRQASVRLARDLTPVLDLNIAITVVEGLTHDPDPVVRATAEYGLMTAFEDGDTETQDRRFAQLGELSRERGEITPSAAWEAVRSRQAAGRPVPRHMLELARVVADNHISARVRNAAMAVTHHIRE